MDELKTLTEFRCSNNSEYSCCEDRGITGNPHAVDTDELRAEAIKWIKEIRRLQYVDKPDEEPYYFDNQMDCYNVEDGSCGVPCFIKHFFNITKEDLK